MFKTISEIEITPVKPNKGLVAFSSFVLFDSIFCSSVAIMTRPDGGYRLCFPTKKVSMHDVGIFYPISKQVGLIIKEKVIEKYEEVINQHDRYGNTKN